jgi:phospholipid/cholesterol/gamma-HCH transport system substrate-binding protein
MSAKTRNLLVGVTVIVAGCVLGWMILEFGAKSVSLFAAPQVPVQFDATRVDGLSVGSPVTFQGVVVGRITTLTRKSDGNGVTIGAMLDTLPPVPRNIHGEIVTTNLIGGGSTMTIELGADSDKPETLAQMPTPGQPYPPLKAQYVGLKLNILPPGTTNAFAQISSAATAISDFGTQVRDQNLVLHLDQAVQNINQKATQAGQVLDAIQAIIGNNATQSDLHQVIADARTTFANLAKTSADLPKLSQQAQGVLSEAHDTIHSAQTGIDDLHRRLGDALMNASKVLDNINELATKINKGQGTAGMLVNDPKLYQALVEDLRALNGDELTLARVLQQWEQEGVSLKGLP